MTRRWTFAPAWLPAALLTLVTVCVAPAPAGADDAAPELARVWARADGIDLEPLADTGGFVLTVSGPDGFHHRSVVDSGETIAFSAFAEQGGSLPDGSYTYELRAMAAETRSRAGTPDAGADLERRHRAPRPARIQTGSFAVVNGVVVAGGETEPGAGGSGGGNVLATKDHLINDDLIVTGSACIGFDCVNGEVFGFDTIRLKENNLRIKFEDTSSVGAFPTNDWELVANDPASGGLDRFSIRDVDADRDVFTVEAGAPEAALYVGDQGDVGLGTSTPVLNLHIVSGDTPGLRLEQDGSGTFDPQTWDVAGNEVNFFIRDVTGGSTLPLRIQSGAPSNSLFIADDGDVGVGTDEPSARLDVAGSLAVSGTVDGRDVAADGSALDAHLADLDNPHGVTAAQAGADPAGAAANAVAGHEAAFDHGAIPSALPVPVSEGGTGATDAAGARANLGIPDGPKVGTVPGADFGGNPAATATVTFDEPFPAGTSYAVLLTAVTSDAKKVSAPNVVAKDETGFTVTLGQGNASDLVEVGWLARPVSE